MDCLVRSTQGRVVECRVTGPMGEPVTAAYGVLEDEKTVVIEVACCCGLSLIAGEKREPAVTTSYGVGELIRRALDDGWRRFIVGLGGSGTNDGGAGMLSALGVRFMDVKGGILPPGGGALERLAVADFSGLDSRLAEAAFEIASDVSNPLTGETGASRVFGPQKGASPEKALWLDNCLKRYADVLHRQGWDVESVPGAGAAGGLGAAFLLLGGKMTRGVELVLTYTGYEKKLKGADIVFTGEGSVDDQTLYGKTPCGVAVPAARRGIPVVVFAGRVGGEPADLAAVGIREVRCITPAGQPLKEALRSGARNLTDAVEVFLRESAANEAE